MTGWRLVSDAGGTNVRFARASSAGGLYEHRTYPVARFADFLSVLRVYLGETGGAEGCTGVAVGAAGPVASGMAHLTNAKWEIGEGAVCAAMGAPCTLINDVQAVALSLPSLTPADFTIIGSTVSNPARSHKLLVANIGTGFGAATLVRSGSGWTACPSEAGHMTLVLPESVDSRLRKTVSCVEDVLSGRGLCNLLATYCPSGAPLDPCEILARSGSDPDCAAALLLFTQVGGDVLGNLALAVASWDGVFLCGSVAKGFVRFADPGLFRQAFEDKGRMSDWMKQIPVSLITKEDAALIGLTALQLPPSGRLPPKS